MITWRQIQAAPSPPVTDGVSCFRLIFQVTQIRDSASDRTLSHTPLWEQHCGSISEYILPSVARLKLCLFNQIYSLNHFLSFTVALVNELFEIFSLWLHSRHKKVYKDNVYLQVFEVMECRQIDALLTHLSVPTATTGSHDFHLVAVIISTATRGCRTINEI